MPDLTDPIHLNMLRGQPDSSETGRLYGLHWGDPNAEPHLAWVRDEYCAKFVDPRHVAIEIGPGGGRWTRYMLGFQRLYAVDFYQELLDELAKFIRCPQLIPVKNDGCDFPGVADSSIDFVLMAGVCLGFALALAARTWVKLNEPRLLSQPRSSTGLFRRERQLETISAVEDPEEDFEVPLADTAAGARRR